LLALAGIVPEELYGWKPAETARTFSAVLVHIAAGNLGLLAVAGRVDADLYGDLEGSAQLPAMIRINVGLERTLTGKQAVIEFLTRALDAVKSGWTATENLDATVDFLGSKPSVRSAYLRMLVHTHEHMGQAVAYARAMGLNAPWPDPLKNHASAGEP
jgi:uncharacterized damage-inducible protein DinB